ncbi:hypothetical protein [Allopusillimonas ginsengisoli]|uniref:hypothetical protein n=1 Tax=Allopusillimonas ginsengisoli TaxID=453575 RepID=UPI00101FB2FE|nr:hypothetical protein [Allopusillimonas ginsengisoli]TEA79172.1 hypothetical protein ERE07_07240 [Allopusillimonas ginsengisoli]
MPCIKLTVLVSETWRSRFPEVVENCRRAGMVIERELVAVGIISGSIDESAVNILAKIEGVQAIEPERTNWKLDT